MTLCRLVVLLYLVQAVKGYSTGILPPAEEACATMFPSGHGVKPQMTLSPFVIRVSDTSYYQKRIITVTLDSRCNRMFKGFLIQARRADPKLEQNEFIGAFTPIMLTRNVCGPAGNSGLTHTSNQTKSSLDFMWTAPPGLNDHIVFRATFVEDFRTFWMNVTSPIVTGNLQIAVPYQTTWMTRTLYPCSVKSARFNLDPRCGDSMGCFHDCEAIGDCSFQVSWKVWDEHALEFTIKVVFLGNGDKWSAIGFSEDTQMGWDSVSECVEVGTGVFVYPSINLDHSNIRLSQHTVGLTPISGSDRDGVFECKFHRNKTVAGDNRYFDLNRDFYLLVAKGRATPDGNKIQHISRPWVSRVVIDLQTYSSIHVHTITKDPPRPISHSQTPPQQRTLNSQQHHYHPHQPHHLQHLRSHNQHMFHGHN